MRAHKKLILSLCAIFLLVFVVLPFYWGRTALPDVLKRATHQATEHGLMSVRVLKQDVGIWRSHVTLQYRLSPRLIQNLKAPKTLRHQLGQWTAREEWTFQHGPLLIKPDAEHTFRLGRVAGQLTNTDIPSTAFMQVKLAPSTTGTLFLSLNNTLFCHTRIPNAVTEMGPVGQLHFEKVTAQSSQKAQHFSMKADIANMQLSTPSVRMEIQGLHHTQERNENNATKLPVGHATYGFKHISFSPLTPNSKTPLVKIMAKDMTWGSASQLEDKHINTHAFLKLGNLWNEAHPEQTHAFDIDLKLNHLDVKATSHVFTLIEDMQTKASLSPQQLQRQLPEMGAQFMQSLPEMFQHGAQLHIKLNLKQAQHAASFSLDLKGPAFNPNNPMQIMHKLMTDTTLHGTLSIDRHMLEQCLTFIAAEEVRKEAYQRYQIAAKQAMEAIKAGDKDAKPPKRITEAAIQEKAHAKAMMQLQMALNMHWLVLHQNGTYQAEINYAKGLFHVNGQAIPLPGL